MKISQETTNILKNFASINQGILISPGKTLRTRTKSVFAEAVINEEFPVEVGIYNLNNFLNVVSLFKDPEFDFGDTSLRIAESNGKAETLYAYAGAGLVALPTKAKKLPAPTEMIEFAMSEDQWNTVQKAASVFNKPEVKITSDGNVIRMGTENHKQQMGNAYSMVLEGDPNGTKCNMVISMDDMRLLKGSYTGTVTPTYVVFKNSSLNLTYFIGVEPTTSSFGKDDDGE
jgi:hypothetical protein